MAVRITRAGVGLTIGIIILALAVLGGLYLAKERGEQARRDEAIQIAQQNLESQSEGANPLNEGEEGEQKPEGAGENTGQATDNDTTSEGTKTPATDELPQTGAGDIVSVIALALLTFTGVSYVHSRRAFLKSR